MSDAVKIQFGGLGLVSTTEKQLDRSTKYDHLFPMPDWKQRIVRRNGPVESVIEDIKSVIYGYREQTQRFAPYMRGENIYETCRNIWNFWYNRCLYKEDVKGLEQLRTSPRSYWEGAGFNPDEPDDFGIDCDDFSIAVAQTLLNLKIPCYLRIARYPLVDYFQHIYVIVPDGKKLIVIDCVLDEFDKEKFPVETKEYLIMDKRNFNGIDVAILSGFGDSQSPLLDVVTGSDFSGLTSFGTTADSDKELDALYQHIQKTRALVAENPELVKEAEYPEQFLKMLDYAIQYWNTDKRDEALAILASREDQANQLRGFCPGSDTSESEVELHAISGGGYLALGKIGGERKFFNKVKEAVKKTGQGIKEAAKAVVKYNPLSLAARAGVLLALKTNLFHMAATLKWGYLSESEARKQGFDMDEWAKAVKHLQDTEDMYSKILQGSKDELKHTILSGRAGDLNALPLGSLGIEPITTTTTTAAATGFIAKIKSWVKNIDLKKMLKKVDLKKLATAAQQAFKPKSENAPTDSITDRGNLPPSTEDEKKNARDSENDDGTSAALPLLVIGGLGVLFLASGKNKKENKSGYAGFGSTKTRKKSKRKKEVNIDTYDIPALTGADHVPGSFSPGNSHKRKKRKGAKAKTKSKVKKFKLR
jgi:hypothetical protein